MRLGKLSDCEAHLLTCLKEAAEDQKTKEVYLVGGCVRDKLLGDNTWDFDVSCPNAVLRALMSSVQSSLWKKKDTAPLEFVRELPPFTIHEYPSAGTDVFSFKLRHKDTKQPFKVDFRGLKEESVRSDALTRDFRLNAIYYSVVDDELVDPFNVG
jgi:tRNA nucleotidyltransferase/poly(A) polymerase